MIPFTQYLRPNGEKRAVTISMTATVEHWAHWFIAAGGRYECEEMRTGEISLTAVHEVEGEDQDIAIVLCRNDPNIRNAVEELVRRSIAWLDINDNLGKQNEST